MPRQTSATLLTDYPTPLNKEDLFSAELEAAFPLKVASIGDDFFLDVGATVQLQVTDSQNRLMEYSASSVTFSLLSAGDTATVTTDGLLTIHGTSSPFINDRPMIFVVARSGTDFGVGQFAIRDNDNDADLLADSVEVAFGLDPEASNRLESDLDNDSLSDHSELILNSNPLVEDTDQDGFTDDQEYLADSDFLDPHCTPDGCTYFALLPFITK